MSTEVRDIKIKFKINGEERHPVDIRLSIALNSLPSIQVTHHKGVEANQSATDLSSADVFKEMGARQDLSFKERTKGEVDLSIDDGANGSLTIKGLLTAPSYNYSVNNVALSDFVIPEYALVESLTYACYNTTLKDIEEADERPKLEGSLTKYIGQIADYIKTKWQDGKEETKKTIGELAFAASEAQDKINDKVKSYFEELLSNSEDTLGWKQLKDDLTSGELMRAEQLDARIVSILKSHSGSFISVINQIAEEFQCIWIPHWHNTGKILNRDQLYKNVQSLKVTPINIYCMGGYAGLFPTRYIAVEANPFTPDIEQTVSSQFITYPESAKITPGGSPIIIPGPGWLPGWYIPDDVKSEGGSPQEGLKIDKISETVAKVADQFEDFNSKCQNIAKAWAKSAYLWQSLVGSRVQVTCPLDLTVELGARYNVQNAKGEVIFQGTAASITHSITGGGGHNNASTSIDFSHVELGSFKLPGKD